MSFLLSIIRGWFKTNARQPLVVAIEDLDPRPNHRLIFDEIKEFVDKQYAQMDVLDTKAGLVAATSTALTAGFLALLNGVEGTIGAREGHVTILPLVHRTVSDRPMLLLIFGLAFLPYLIILFGFLKSNQIRSWEIVPRPATLLSEYWAENANHTLLDLCATMAEVVDYNQRILDDKIRWVNRLFGFLVLDVVILFVAAVIGAWSSLI